MKAWRVESRGFPDSIVAAETRSQARYRTWRAANDAGFKMPFADFTPRRAPEYDGPLGPNRLVLVGPISETQARRMRDEIDP